MWEWLFGKPKPHVMTEYEEWLVSEWYERWVAKYKGAQQESVDLYDGLIGSTLIRYLDQYARGAVMVTRRNMEDFLVKKGHEYVDVNGRRVFRGIRVILYGDVREGSFGT